MTSFNKRPKILTFVQYYIPGYKSGGPIQTIANMVARMSDHYRFKVVTKDRDSGDQSPYPNIKIDDWQEVGKADVFYASTNYQSFNGIRRLLNNEEYDVIYLNSFFAPVFTIKVVMLRFLKLIPAKPVVIAPRGEFSKGALSIKRLKKKVYLKFAKLLRLYDNVLWQASSEYEKRDIQRQFGITANVDIAIAIAPDLPSSTYNHANEDSVKRRKIPGELDVVFLSKIDRIKNLDTAIHLLSQLHTDVQFDIYGPVKDVSFWNECKPLIRNVPFNITINYKGPVEHTEVYEVLRKYHLFFLPTKGENYGHVVIEALTAGCPVLISDRTPWRNLEEKKVGWDLPLEQPEKFLEVLHYCADMDNDKYESLSKTAEEYGKKFSNNKEIIQQNIDLFKKVLTYRQ